MEGLLIILILQSIFMLLLHGQVVATRKEVKKGNKDQQEIKTRLTNLRQNVKRILTATEKLTGKTLGGGVWVSPKGKRGVGKTRQSIRRRTSKADRGFSKKPWGDETGW